MPLSREDRDDIARRAARLLLEGSAESVPQAIRAALGGAAGAEQVSVAMVREHARGLALEALGEAGYRSKVAEILGQAEELMTLLETLPGEPRTVLVGRAARGQVDADPCCRIRVETDEDLATIAARIVEAGYDEPAFSTSETRFGRLSRLDVDDRGVDMRITRCPPSLRIPMDQDLRTGARIPSLRAYSLRRMVAGLRAVE